MSTNAVAIANKIHDSFDRQSFYIRIVAWMEGVSDHDESVRKHFEAALAYAVRAIEPIEKAG